MFCVIAFSGQIGSGKTSISKLIAKKFNFQRVSFGDYVRKIATEKNIDPSRLNLQNLGESLMTSNPHLFCFNVLHQASMVNKSVVVDGIRHEIALTEIKKIIYPNKVFHIHLQINEEIRLERVNQRQYETLNDIKNIDAHPSEAQVASLLLNIADLVVDSEKDIFETIQTISDWLKIDIDK